MFTTNSRMGLGSVAVLGMAFACIPGAYALDRLPTIDITGIAETERNGSSVHGFESQAIGPPEDDSCLQGSMLGDEAPLPSPSLGGDRAPFRWQTLWVPSQDLRQTDAELASYSQRLSIGYPLRIEGNSVWIGLLQFSAQQFETQAVLPDTRLKFPERLWNLNVGTLHARTLDNGVKVGGMLRVGSASDQLFASIHEMTLMTLLFAEFPWGPRDAWMGSVFYSPTAQTNFPLPGVAYVWRPTSYLQANIGVPAELHYQMTESMRLDARYTPLTNAFVQLSQVTRGGAIIFGRYEVVNDVFWLQERLREQDRFFVFDQRVAAGISLPLPRGLALEFSGDYLFDRKFFQASSFSDNRVDVLRVASGAGVGATLVWNR